MSDHITSGGNIIGVGPQERQTVPPAERVQTRSMTRRGLQASSSELTLPVPLATRGTKRRAMLEPVGGSSPKRPSIGPQERQTVPPAERVQTRSMTRRGPQASSSELTLPVPLATREKNSVRAQKNQKEAMLKPVGGSSSKRQAVS
ncbi:hypothetical protein TNCT_410431 [Trichonephila clavata]|uniref:Uncharacterized protein n=1 Tax=Trichonephila clavata TaxID=2740835 RepID=A0A8X6HML4_TRICU|nr:hypothetical protein TNCT_410431 [Trichonephila clavata]